VRVWDVASGKQVLSLKGPRGSTSMLAFSPDGKSLAAGGYDIEIVLWDARTGKEQHRLEDIPPGVISKRIFNAVRGLGFSPDSRTLIARSNNTIRAWNVATGKRQQSTLLGLDDQPTVVALTPDGELLATAGAFADDDDVLGDSIHLCDVKTGRHFRRLKGHKGEVQCLAFAPDGKTLASGGADQTLRFWDVATGKQMGPAHACGHAVTSLAYADGGKVLACAAGAIRLLDPRTGQDLTREQGHSNAVRGVAYAPDGKLLATASDDHTVCLWSANGRLVHRLRGHGGPVAAVAFSPDGKTLVTGGGRQIHLAGPKVVTPEPDTTVRLWDVASGKPGRTLTGHTAAVTAIAFAPDGKTVASGSADRTARLWDVSTGREIRRVEEENQERLAITSVAFTADGKALVTACNWGTVRLWDPATGKELGKLQAQSLCLNSVAVAPDGGRVVAAGDLGVPAGAPPAVSATRGVRLWDTVGGKALYALPWHEDDEDAATGVNAVAYSPDGRLLASAGADHVVRVWEIATGRQRLALAGHRSPVLSVAFAADGRSLASAGADMTALVWDLTAAAFPGGRPDPIQGPKALEELWADLASEDAVAANRAIATLAASPDQAVPFLRERLKDVRAVLRDIPQRVAELGSDRFAPREKASAELERVLELAEPALRRALADQPPLEARRRLEALLGKLTLPVRSPERLRRLRAMEALERAGAVSASPRH
jgi:WD40 repeat protein